MSTNEIVLFWMLFGIMCLLIVLNGRRGYWKGKHSDPVEVAGWADEAKFWRLLEIRRRDEEWILNKPNSHVAPRVIRRIDPAVVPPLGRVENAKRGGGQTINFTDRFGVDCIIGCGSNEDGPNFWIGVRDARPRLLESDEKLELPDNCIFDTTVHLTSAQTDSLMLHVLRWVETRSFEELPRVPSHS